MPPKSLRGTLACRGYEDVNDVPALAAMEIAGPELEHQSGFQTNINRAHSRHVGAIHPVIDLQRGGNENGLQRSYPPDVFWDDPGLAPGTVKP